MHAKLLYKVSPTRHLSSLPYTILTTQSARGMVPDAEVLDHLLIVVPDQVHPVPRPLPPHHRTITACTPCPD